MSENSSTLGSEIRRIKIEDVSYETFTLILEYLYTDQVQCIPEDQAVPLLIVSLWKLELFTLYPPVVPLPRAAASFLLTFPTRT